MKDIGSWTHYILLADGIRIGVNPNTYPFKAEQSAYFHPNKADAA